MRRSILLSSPSSSSSSSSSLVSPPSLRQLNSNGTHKDDDNDAVYCDGDADDRHCDYPKENNVFARHHPVSPSASPATVISAPFSGHSSSSSNAPTMYSALEQGDEVNNPTMSPTRQQDTCQSDTIGNFGVTTINNNNLGRLQQWTVRYGYQVQTTLIPSSALLKQEIVPALEKAISDLLVQQWFAGRCDNQNTSATDISKDREDSSAVASISSSSSSTTSAAGGSQRRSWTRRRHRQRLLQQQQLTPSLDSSNGVVIGDIHNLLGLTTQPEDGILPGPKGVACRTRFAPGAERCYILDGGLTVIGQGNLSWVSPLALQILQQAMSRGRLNNGAVHSDVIDVLLVELGNSTATSPNIFSNNNDLEENNSNRLWWLWLIAVFVLAVLVVLCVLAFRRRQRGHEFYQNFIPQIATSHNPQVSPSREPLRRRSLLLPDDDPDSCRPQPNAEWLDMALSPPRKTTSGSNPSANNDSPFNPFLIDDIRDAHGHVHNGNNVSNSSFSAPTGGGLGSFDLLSLNENHPANTSLQQPQQQQQQQQQQLQPQKRELMVSDEGAMRFPDISFLTSSDLDTSDEVGGPSISDEEFEEEDDDDDDSSDSGGDDDNVSNETETDQVSGSFPKIRSREFV